MVTKACSRLLVARASTFTALNLAELRPVAITIGDPLHDFFGIVSPRPMRDEFVLTKMCITAMSLPPSPSLDAGRLSALAQHLVKG
jgi:hypothetical protein